MADAAVFQPHRFRTAARHYLAGRPAYAPRLIRLVADLLRLSERDRLLDLGCGPGVLAGATFAFVLSMGDFLAPQLLGGNDSALMVSNLVWSLFGVAYNWPLGAAVAVLILVMVLVILTVTQRLERRWRVA